MFSSDRHPHPIDLHVGAKLRQRRKSLGMSQQRLGEEIDITFQQVQKYERGANRVSASKLYEMSQVLNIPVTFFFDGYGNTAENETFLPSQSEQNVQAFLSTSEGLEIAETFPRIKSAKLRRRIADLMRALANDTDT